MTDAERKLWQGLRDRQLLGFKFRRQVPIGSCVADFACMEAKLIVEVDGGQYNENKRGDSARTRWLEARGYTVLRFWNDLVLQETNAVLESILGDSRREMPPPCPPLRGGGNNQQENHSWAN